MKLYCFFLIFLTSIYSYANDNVKHTRFFLKNGMEVILVPNHKIPAITHMLLYKVGSTSDPMGKSGLAHFLEHMMFKSTGNLKPGDFFRIIAENGGTLNASTIYSYTNYYENILKDKLPLVMQLEADRMTKLKLDPEEVKKERQVIIEERSLRYDNVPEALLREQMYASLYINHPNHRSVIGYKHEMEDLQVEDLRDFYNKNYQPQNAVLIVAGDITLQELEPLAKKYYGNIKNAQVKTKNDIKLLEPPQIVERKLTLCDKKVKIETLSRIYQTPMLKLEDLSDDFTLEIMTYILGGNQLSRLYKTFVKTQKATETGSYYYNASLSSPGIMHLTVYAKEGVKLEIIESELNSLIAKFYNHGVTKEELENAKSALISSNIYEKESFKNLASLYGYMAANSIPFSYFENWEENINSVTLEQVNNLIMKIFKPQNSVTGMLFNDKSCNNYVN